MRLTQNDLPATPAVSTAEAKAFARVADSQQDTAIAEMVKAATQEAERRTGRALIRREIIAVFDAYEAAPPLDLPYGPVESVDLFERWDEDTNDWVTLPATDYQVAGDRIVLSELDAADWPEIERARDALRVTYTAGYGTTADSVPSPIRQAIQHMAAAAYRSQRPPDDGSAAFAAIQSNQQARKLAMSLLSPYVHYTLR